VTTLALRSRQGRIALTAVTVGSGMALLDGTVVNIALPRLGEDLGASVAQLQWVVTGYLLTLASLILVGGGLADRLGRRRIYVVGVAGFGLSSALCAFAQTPDQLVAVRLLQGVAGALLTPGALALIQGGFVVADRPRAIGIWAGTSGVATAIGPVVGGLLLDHAGWRWVFAINVPLCLLVLVLARAVPESRDPDAPPVDLLSAGSTVVVLAALTYLLTAWPTLPVSTVVGLVVVALLAAAVFGHRERLPGALVPLELFGSRTFTAANAMTFLVYGALGAGLLLLVLQLQVSSGYGPIAAGLATLPLTLAMLLLSSRFAALAQRIGPRIPMSVGPLVCAAGMALLATVGRDAPYLRSVFPGVLVFGLGLAGLVAPLTATVLASAPDRHAGIASGLNNAVARAGSLLAVAAIPAAVGLGGADYRDPDALTSGYRSGLLVCAALLTAAAAVSWAGLRTRETDAARTPVPPS
jgi:EmrB/QacA subfamily drug resistance transporter